MVTLLLSLLAATPIITGAGDAWTVDGKPLENSCETLRQARQTIVEANPTTPWSSLEPVLQRARRCGVTRFALQLEGAEPLWLSLERGDDPVVVAGRATHIVHDGASVDVKLGGGAELFWRAFPTMTRPCLALAPEASAGILSREAGAILAGAGKRPARVCVLLDEDLAALPANDRNVVDLLRGGDGGPAGASGDGHLTRWFGRSVAPVAEEKEVPRWTRISSMVCRGDDGTQVWGVGTVSGIRNHALARTTADNRARATIAAFIQTEISRSKHAVKSYTAQTLSGVQIVDHYFEGKSTWALATMGVQKQTTVACPAGSEVVRAWRWKNLDPAGGFGSDKPAWARAGLYGDKDRVWVTASSRSDRPLAESTAVLEILARSRLTAALAQGALGVPAQRRTDTGGDCLLSVPWTDVSAAAPVETWYDVGSSTLFGRAGLDLAEVRSALGPGCDEKLVGDLVTASQRGTPGRSARTGVPANVKYPQWVLRGSGPAGKGNDRVFYGVGSVSGIKNHALARTTADNRARAEIAKMFEVYSATLMKDYMRATPKGDEEQHIGMAIKTFSAMTLSGVQVVDHWFHPDGTVYALAQLDLDAFAGNLGKMRELNQQVRDYVRKNAERVHESLQTR